MTKFIVIAAFLLLIGFVSARPTDKLSKDEFDVNHFLKKTRIQMIQKKNDNAKTEKPPHLKIRSFPNPQVDVKEGQTIVLQCEASGTPPPQIHWLKNAQRIVQSNDQIYDSLDQDSALGLSLTRGRLVINCADIDDTATYTCVAENAFSRVVAQSQVNVTPLEKNGDTTHLTVLEQQACIEKKSFGVSSSARIIMWTHTRLEMIGSNAQLSCRTSGDNVQVQWLGPNESKIDLINSKFSILDNGDLFIKKISWDDMGDYTCIAHNSISEDKITTFLYPTLPENKK